MSPFFCESAEGGGGSEALALRQQPTDRPITPAQQQLATSLELPDRADGLDEATFLRLLADAVDYWLQHRTEQLMSLCYTLDVDERAVAAVLHPAAPEPANVGLARVLYERQRRRLHTKTTFQTPPLDDEDAW